MPSYPQPPYQRFQGYLTPPDELLRGYVGKENMAPHHQFQPNPYPVQVRPGQNNERPHHDPYPHHVQQRTGMINRISPPGAMYPGAPFLSSINALGNNHQGNGYYKPVVLPPMRTYPPVSAPSVEQRPHNQVTVRSHPPQQDRQREQKDERPVGGVSAKLDYEMDTMTDFVTKTARGMYELLNHPSICIIDIDIIGSIMPNRQAPAEFRKWVHGVLSATRLPSSTILLAFDYLSIHMKYAQAARVVYGENELCQVLTTALILGSKFLDDNTFINRSWAEVSNIDVGTLNRLEHQWLQQMGFRLHRDPNSLGGFQAFQTSWRQFEAERRIAHDTGRAINVPSQMTTQHTQQAYPPTAQSAFERISPPPAYVAETNRNYSSTGYPRYDSFAGIRSSTNTSPASAPHTGPTTPEYYGPRSAWPSITEAYGQTRQLPPAYTQPPSALSSIATVQSAPQPFVTMPYQASPVYATSHGSECFCNTCNRQYMMGELFLEHDSFKIPDVQFLFSIGSFWNLPWTEFWTNSLAVPDFGMPQSVVG